MRRAGGRRLAFVLMLLVARRASGASGDWIFLDAESVGRGGVDRVQQLERSPGACADAGVRLRLSIQRPYLGTELAAESAVLEGSARGYGAALALQQLRSPVHRDTRLSVALQKRARPVRVGCGATLGAASFAGYATRWSLVPRAGAGGTLPIDLRWAASCELEAAADGRRLPRLSFAAEAPLLANVRLALQLEREPGVASRTLAGCAWRRAAVRLLAGYDIAAQASTAALAWTWPRGNLAWGARSHPELGWSHAWTCVLER